MFALKGASIAGTSIYPAALPPLHRSENFEYVDSICVSIHSLLFLSDGAIIVVIAGAIIFSNVILIFHLIYKI